jgi:hypothetical protein
MEPKYSIGQKVIIQPVSEPGPTKRENDINRYAGQIGEVTDFYWISPRSGQLFYIYNVLLGREKREVVVYEDEMEPCLF